jgi:hypothetical protein
LERRRNEEEEEFANKKIQEAGKSNEKRTSGQTRGAIEETTRVGKIERARKDLLKQNQCWDSSK